MIPPFDEKTGCLPAGIHPVLWEDVPKHFGTNQRRLQLIGGLRLGLRSLAGAGCRQVWLDGSFVTAKEFPGDYDAAWELAGVDPNLLDPAFLDFRNRRAAMKVKFGGEFFPANFFAVAGVTYREFFSRDKNGMSKGLIQIDPTSTL